MLKNILFIAVIALSALIVISFFLPWAQVDVSAIGVSREVAKQADTTLKDTPFAGKFIKHLDKATEAISEFGDVKIKTRITGYEIPKLVNQDASKVAISLVQIMFKSVENLDMKSYLVYLLPLFGIICGLLAFLGLANRVFVVAMLLLSGAVGLGGLYNLFTAPTGNLAVSITIMNGLWFTMYSFLTIFLISIGWVVIAKK